MELPSAAALSVALLLAQAGPRRVESRLHRFSPQLLQLRREQWNRRVSARETLVESWRELVSVKEKEVAMAAEQAARDRLRGAFHPAGECAVP